MLNGKVAVVTGASRGIGRAVAIRLASEGATVVINYNGSRERAEEVKAEIEQAGGKAEIKQCNVSDYKACEEMFKEIVSEFGSVDVLVNNAGITRDGLLMKMSEEDYDIVLIDQNAGKLKELARRYGATVQAQYQRRRAQHAKHRALPALRPISHTLSSHPGREPPPRQAARL